MGSLNKNDKSQIAYYKQAKVLKFAESPLFWDFSKAETCS